MFDIDKSLNKMLGTIKKRGGKRDWDGDGVPNKKDCQPRNTMRQDEDEIPKGWPKYVVIDGVKTKVKHYNIPSVRTPVSPYGPSNDYKGKCPHCGKWIQADQRNSMGNFIICPNCKKPT